MDIIRSNLYIPANKVSYISNINKLNADMYTIDLEDSLHADEKENGRNIIKGLKFDNKNVYVRINNINDEMLDTDLKAIINSGLVGVCYPKCKSEDEIKKLDHQLLVLEYLNKLPGYSIKIHLLIENALAVIKIEKLINAARDRITSVVFGIVDYCNDLGIDINYKSTVTARSLIVINAKAYGLHAIDCPYIDFHNMFGFIEDTKLSASLGYKGRIVIHPTQIPYANELYTPGKEQIINAKNIIKLYEQGVANKEASISSDCGMIAKAVYVNAKKLLESR